MNAKIIRSREEFEEFYYYKEAPAKFKKNLQKRLDELKASKSNQL